ncbi:tetratricopeptide repeat protein [candidate division WOR-3 bacterium]|nr:tetratricopeptide repeat protein [candidate division WOR-3 bacterium]
MKSHSLPLALCSLLLASFLAGDSLTIEYYSPDNIKRFADFLYDQEDFQRAAAEYQRYLFAVETLPTNTDSTLFRIGQCLRRNNDFAKALEYFQNVIDSHSYQEMAYQAHYQVALCYFLMEQYEQSSAYLEILLPDTTQPGNDVQQLRALNMIRIKQWDEAFLTLSTIQPRDETTTDLMKFACAGQNLPHKSKTIAGIYSTIIPGLGKVYCKRTVDGIQSLFSTTILGWQAYDGFHDDGVSSLKGWIFGTIGGLFYLGNIYGSVVAAEIYNEEHEEKLLSTIKVYINVHFD